MAQKKDVRFASVFPVRGCLLCLSPNQPHRPRAVGTRRTDSTSSVSHTRVNGVDTYTHARTHTDERAFIAVSRRRCFAFYTGKEKIKRETRDFAGKTHRKKTNKRCGCTLALAVKRATEKTPVGKQQRQKQTHSCVCSLCGGKKKEALSGVSSP